MPDLKTVVEELEGYQPPKLQRAGQRSGVEAEPAVDEIAKRPDSCGGEEYRYVDNQQPLDDGRKLGQGEPKLGGVAVLGLEVFLRIISIVDAHYVSQNPKHKIRNTALITHS